MKGRTDGQTEEEAEALLERLSPSTLAHSKGGDRYRLVHRRAGTTETTQIINAETKAERRDRRKAEKRSRIAGVKSAMSQDLVAAVIQRRRDRGLDLSRQCGAFGITNEVCQVLNEGHGTDAEGRLPWGLLAKTGGNRAIVFDGATCRGDDEASGDGYATDYIIQRGTWLGVDILGDGGGRNDPQWNPETGQETRNERMFRNPIGTLDTPQPVPVPRPTPTPSPIPSGDLVTLLQRVDTISSQLQRLESFVKMLADMIADARKDTTDRCVDLTKRTDELKTLNSATLSAARAGRTGRIAYIGAVKIDPQ